MMNTETETTGNEELNQQPESTEMLELEAESGHVDYSQYGKKELVQLVEGLLKETDMRKADEVLRHAKPVFDELRESERAEALERFVAEGGEKDDFDYKPDEFSQRFEQAVRQLRDRKTSYMKDQEKSREKNLADKQALLEQLRQLVDSEETNVSLGALKKVQDEWKRIGPVPSAQSRDLWANYHALIERFYSNRSIYFELKELDRKKNLEAKQDIVEKAEKLAAQETSPNVIRELNDLHEEYKHVGPVPKDDQEALWQRFKAASDVIYSRRKEQLEVQRKEQEQNVGVKVTLCEEAEKYAAFQSDKIAEWNDQTRQILDLQKRWEASGFLPRDKAKEINKRFWAAFKGFFHHKNEFFRRLEAYREENLRRKTTLCEQVEALKDSDNVEATADKIKAYQLEWKEIGPVPEKQREAIFERFKQACDAFFDRRREQRNSTDREFEKNFAVKSEICDKIEKMAAEKSSDMAAFNALRDQWEQTGFVPRKNLHAIQQRYANAVQSFLQNTGGLSDKDRERMQLSAEVNLSRQNPAAMKNVQKKEQQLRKRISQLENDIAVWRNNLEFFANSKGANQLRTEYQSKIKSAEDEIGNLKKQVQVFYDA
jgi:hypothetical protein